MAFRNYSAWILLNICLAACGGGGGGSSDSTNTPPPDSPVANANPAGIWTGTITSTELNAVEDVIGVVKSNGSARFVSLASGRQFFGDISISQNNFSGTLTGVTFVGDEFANGSSSGTLSVEGEIAEASSLSGNYVGLGDEGTFVLTYSNLYERGAVLEKLEGHWSAPETIQKSYLGLSTADIGVVVDSSGVMRGVDEDGCDYFGSLSVPDASANIYDLSIEISNCGPLDGQFTGIGVTDDNVQTDDTVILAVANSDMSLAGKIYVAEAETASGIWYGAFQSSASGLTNTWGTVAENGTAFFFTNEGTQIAANVEVFAHISRFDGTAYAPFGSTFQDGTVRGPILAVGSTQTQTWLSGLYSGNGDSGNYSFNFDPIYLRDSSLEMIAGTWSTPSPTGGTGTLDIVINSSGALSGSSDGCDYFGTLRIINSDFNVYFVEVEVESCGEISGTYEGLAVLFDINNVNDRMSVDMTNGETSLWAELERN